LARYAELGLGTVAELFAAVTEDSDLIRVDAPVGLRVGQFWSTLEDTNQAWELVALTAETAECISWTVNHDGSVLSCHEHEMPWGAGAPDGKGCSWPTDALVEFLTQGGALLITTSADRHTQRSGVAYNDCDVIHYRQVDVYISSPMLRQRITPWPAGATVYTDGAYREEGTFMERATGTERRIGASAVYVDSPSPMRIRIPGVVEHESSYTTELLALAIAKRHACGHEIHSDSQAAIDAERRLNAGRGGTAAVVNTLSSALCGSASILKVKAHVETRELNKAKWSCHEAGNVKADRTAANDTVGAGGPIETWDDRTVDRMLTEDSTFVWRRGRSLVVEAGKAADARRLLEYSCKRDATRMDRGDRPRWQGTTAKLAADMWKQTAGPSPGRWARAVRIIWDKHATGANRRKWSQEDDLPVCTVCGCLTSQRHTIVECGKFGLRGIRDRALRRFWGVLGATPYGTPARRILDVVAAHLSHEEAVTIWTGAWAPGICTAVSATDAAMSAAEYGKVVKALAHLATGVDEMYRIEYSATLARAQPTCPDWSRQMLITDFLPPRAAAHGTGASDTDTENEAEADDPSAHFEAVGRHGEVNTPTQELDAGRAGDSRAHDG
jgi:hypothetical protein